MIRVFIGMIIGSVMTIVAAGGSETADRIMSNAYQAVSGTSYLGTATVLAWLGIGCVAPVVWSWWKHRKRERSIPSPYHYLLW